MKEMLTLWPDSPALSALILAAIAVAAMYLARNPAHQAIRAVCRVAHNSLRLASRSVMLAEDRVRGRNRAVLLASGAESAEREIEREFHRVGIVVERDLQGYPALHRSLADLVVRIDEDYRESTDVPPSPPSWIGAVEAIAKIPSSGDTLVSKMLGQINKTLERHQKEVVAEYRKSSGKRHSLLRRMMPHWRKLRQTVDDVGKTITGLQERAHVIDLKMKDYEEIRNATQRAERTLSSSAMTQFVIAGLVLLIAAGGAFINFNLIALPMSEMVGGGSYIGSFKTSDVAAMVIILVELAMGLYLMESLRITRLFPVINALDDRMRRRMILVSFSILLTLACVESALAFMRDRIAADLQALRQTLAGVEHTAPAMSWIPTVGQMVMGFILPFALTFVAIPLESFVHSARTVFGALLAALLRGTAFALRFFGSAFHYTGSLLVSAYDIAIFAPLWVERAVRAGRASQPAAVETKEAADGKA